MKVILDFQNLDESPQLDDFLQKMAENAKETTGYLFCTLTKTGVTQQIYSLNARDLATMVIGIEERYPEIKMLKVMNKMKEFMGGGMNGRRMFGI